jgi:hypothetical protein
VTREDAIDVVKLIQESLFEACFKEMGMNQGAQVGQNYMLPSQSTGGRGGKKAQEMDMNNVSMMSIPKQTKCYVDRIRNVADTKGSGIFDYQELIGIAKQINLQVGDFRNLIDKLNSQNILIMKNSKTYEIVQC